MTYSTTIELDSYGDVVLVCPGSQTKKNNIMKLRVSSDTLQNTSTVFKALLGPRFMEGQRLSSIQSLEIDLPDDAGVIMVIICQAIHFRKPFLPENLRPDLVLEIATLSDKYDFGKALHSFSKAWVDKLLQNATCLARCKLLAASYLLGLSDYFTYLCHWIILHHKGEIKSPVAESGTSVHKIFSLLETARQNTLYDVKTFIEQQAFKHDRFAKKHPWQPTIECAFGRRWKRSGVWPLAQLEQRSIFATLLRMRRASRDKVQNHDIHDKKECSLCYEDCLGEVYGPKSDCHRRVEMRVKADEVEGYIAYPCYPCMRAGEFSHETCNHKE